MRLPRWLRQRRAARQWRAMPREARVQTIADSLPESVNLIATSFAGGPEVYALEYIDKEAGQRWAAPLGSPLPTPGESLPAVWVRLQ